MSKKNEAGTEKTTRIVLGCDHAGFELEKHLVNFLRNEGHISEDLGTFSQDSVDYPDFGLAVALAVSSGEFPRGILVCHSGTGMSIVANKIRGVRAALTRDRESARLSRLHNDSNVLVLGAGFTPKDEAEEIVRVWLATQFEGGRHSRRLEKISLLEEKACEDADRDFWSYHGNTLKGTDAEAHRLLQLETKRHAGTLDLVASESVIHPAILETTGSILTLKYAEGYPGDRLYPGCEVMDEIESLAIERAKLLFGAEHANVQPYSGTQANMAAYFAVLKPGDKIVSMKSSHGGHSTHGGSSSFSGTLYRSFRYGVRKETELLDYEEVEELVSRERPRLLIAGGSFYSRVIDFPRFRKIADSHGALLMVDMAHLAGLVAAGIHPSPVPYADVVTSTTHKTLKGPRGGLLLGRKKLADAFDKAVFPVLQGGPLMHVVLAKAVCFKLAMGSEFREFQLQVVRNSKALARETEKLGYRIVSGGTENHLFVVDTGSGGIDGSIAWKQLESSGILVNKCPVPFQAEGSFGGIRLGSLSLTARGMKETDMAEIAILIDAVLRKNSRLSGGVTVKSVVEDLCSRFPVYQ